jgi:hypothetical protein
MVMSRLALDFGLDPELPSFEFSKLFCTTLAVVGFGFGLRIQVRVLGM